MEPIFSLMALSRITIPVRTWCMCYSRETAEGGANNKALLHLHEFHPHVLLR